MITRVAAGALIAIAIAVAARRAGALAADGAVAAAALGTIAIAAGWEWGALLVVFFVATSLLSHTGAEEKAALTGNVIAKASERDAIQVMANGGLFAVAGALWLLLPWAGWLALGAGALAAATADSWSTEVGTLSRARPRMITTWEAAAPGTSGAVTAAGIAAGICGAIFLGLAVALAGWPDGVAVAAMIGGVAGTLADSFIGARWQSIRRCPACGTATERHVHGCGALTVAAGGVSWLDNDLVNFMAAGCGGLVALALWATQ